MRTLRSLYLTFALLVLTTCQDAAINGVPDVDGGPAPSFGVIPPPLQVAVPLSPTWVSETDPGEGPGGIVIAPMDAIDEYRLLNPLPGATHYSSVRILPGGREAIAVALRHIDPPPWHYNFGWVYLVHFDLETGALLHSALLEGVPGLRLSDGGNGWLMDITQDGKKAYVSLFYSGALAVVDLEAFELERYVEFPPPWGEGTSVFYPMQPRLLAGGHALLINETLTGQVLSMDTETFDLTELVPPEEGGRQVLIEITQDEKTLLQTAYDGLRVIDIQTGAVTKTVPCDYATGVWLTQGDKLALVTCRDENRLMAVDTEGWSEAWSMTIPNRPQRVAADMSGRFGLVFTRKTHELILLDLETHEVMSTVTLPNRGWEPDIWPGRVGR